MCVGLERLEYGIHGVTSSMVETIHSLNVIDLMLLLVPLYAQRPIQHFQPETMPPVASCGTMLPQVADPPASSKISVAAMYRPLTSTEQARFIAHS